MIGRTDRHTDRQTDGRTRRKPLVSLVGALIKHVICLMHNVIWSSNDGTKVIIV